MKTIKDLLYNKQNPESRLDIYLPNSEGPYPLFLYFHGGGLEGGSKDDESELRALVSDGIALISADYRLYPSAHFPEFIEDCAAAIRFVFDYRIEGRPFSDVYVGGSSAGAYLAMMLCFNPNYLSVHGLSPNQVAGWFFNAGQATTHFNILKQRGEDSRAVRVDDGAPIYYVGQLAATQNAPNIEFLVSDNDIPGRYEQLLLLYKTIETFDIDMANIRMTVVPDTLHCSYPIYNRVRVFITSNQ